MANNTPQSPITSPGTPPTPGDTYNKGAERNHRSYNSPDNENPGGVASDIGTQFNTFYWQKKALIEMKKDVFFGQLADTTSMPKNFGKKIRKYHYLPLLDERNLNDQGIDAAGLVTPAAHWWDIIDANGDVFARLSDRDLTATDPATGSAYTPLFSSAADAFAEFVERYPHGINIDGVMVQAANSAAGSADGMGNLYGSSRDIGTIASKMPVLSEHGGRVNRVGFKRMELEGGINKFGFFDEWTQESLDFDSDSELMMHINREMLRGANEMTEDLLQIDLLNAAGVIRNVSPGGDMATVDGSTFVDYMDLQIMARDLDNNRMPKNTKIITGSRMVDTRTLDAARFVYIGSELSITVKNMTDNFGNPAFVPVHQYGNATTIANGEIGSVGEFRFIVAPNMMQWSGAGAVPAPVADPITGVIPTVYETSGMTDVFPMLIIGSGAFTTIGFQTDGKSTKFKITTKKPGTAIANRDDPYGEIGFMSIKWYYGSMILRPEWIACIRTAGIY